jgi:hypothetical protein
MENEPNISISTPPPQVPPPDFEKAVKKSIRRWIIVASILILIIGAGVFAYVNRTSIFLVYYFTHTGTKDVQAPTDPAVGKVITLNLPMVYSTDEIVGCPECSSPKEIEINRDLLCFRQLTSYYAHNYKDGYKHLTYIPSTTKFTVQEVFKPHHYGITSIDSGPGDYRMYVLKDENGTLSTALADVIDNPRNCDTNDLFYKDLDKKLLLFSENKDEVKVALTLYNNSTHKDGNSTETDQNNIIQILNTLPSPYYVTNVRKTDSYIPGMKAVTLETDVSTLAYIVGSKLELNIWEIQGLDPEYQATLTPNDIAGMAKKPVDWTKPN